MVQLRRVHHVKGIHFVHVNAEEVPYRFLRRDSLGNVPLSRKYDGNVAALERIYLVSHEKYAVSADAIPDFKLVVRMYRRRFCLEIVAHYVYREVVVHPLVEVNRRSFRFVLCAFLHIAFLRQFIINAVYITLYYVKILFSRYFSSFFLPF